MFPMIIVAGLLRGVIKMVMIFYYFYSLGVLVFGKWEGGGSVLESIWLEHEKLNP